MTDRILITGAILRPGGYELGEGKYYGQGVLLILNLESGRFETQLSINEGNENFPDTTPNLEFTVGAVEGCNIWLCTDTEIRLYTYPDMALLKTFSHPCFHNVHSVAVRGSELYVTSTGLDMVVVLKKETGEIIRYLNTEGKRTWHRFSPDIDYRKVHSTRPHDSHPNYVFWHNDEPWVTRCTQEDAVNLFDVKQRIDISGPNKEISVHDGIVRGDRIYFTSVDSCIVVADLRTLNVVETINISSLSGYRGLRGWCRGLLIVDNIFYVGFSHLRKTKRMNKLAWVGSLISKGKQIENCSILAIDIERKQIIADYIIPSEMLDAVYSILPEPS